MSNRPFVTLAMASASLIAAPAVAQDYALPPLEPMPSASQSAPAVQTAAAAQLPPVYRAPRSEAPVQEMHPERRQHDDDWGDRAHDQRDDYGSNRHHSGGHHGQQNYKLAYTPQQRDWWISECQRRMSYTYDSYENYGRSDNGLGGAAIGGVLGGIAGNRIGGRGNRTEGTVIGAAAGAVLGAAIDKAEDRGGRRRVSRDINDGGYCENYLAAYESGAFGYGHASYGQPMIHRSIGYGHEGHNCGCKQKHSHGHHGKTCKTIVTEKEYWEEVPVEHEVVEEVRYIKQPVKTRYVKQPTKTRYVKQPAKTRYVKQPHRSVKSVKSSK